MSSLEISDSEIKAPESNNSMFNIILFSISFGLLFTALVTTGSIIQIVLKSMEFDNPNFSANGYISLCLVYVVFAITNMLTPSVVSFLGSKLTLISASTVYTLFIANLIITTNWSLYLSSVALGLAAAMLWTAQGNYLTLMSNPETISRNTGIFWVFFCCSQFFGNGFVFWQFFGKEHIDYWTRVLVLGVLTGIAFSSVICFSCLENLRNDAPAPKKGEPWFSDVLKMLGIIKESRMRFLIPTFIFLGTNQSFLASVYPTSIAFTKQFGPVSKSLAGLVGIFTGFGGLVGGGTVMTLGRFINSKVGKYPVIIVGGILLTSAYISIFLNIPNEASLTETNSVSYISEPNPIVGMGGAFLIGLGDSLISTQIYTTLSTIYPTSSASAFATLHFFKASAVAGQFFISTQIGLHAQLAILGGGCILAAICFVGGELLKIFKF